MTGPNVKILLDVILVLSNMTTELSNVRKKRVSLNVTKVRFEVMLILPNVIMEPSNVRKKKDTTKCDKSTVRCVVGTV